jgi:hypothetical protein
MERELQEEENEDFMEGGDFGEGGSELADYRDRMQSMEDYTFDNHGQPMSIEPESDDGLSENMHHYEVESDDEQPLRGIVISEDKSGPCTEMEMDLNLDDTDDQDITTVLGGKDMIEAAVKRLQAFTGLKTNMRPEIREMLTSRTSKQIANAIMSLLDEAQVSRVNFPRTIDIALVLTSLITCYKSAWWNVLQKGEFKTEKPSSPEYKAWYKKHHFGPYDRHHIHGGLYFWSDQTGKIYGGQSCDIESRWTVSLTILVLALCYPVSFLTSEI